MHVSHETIYRSLFIQARGVLKKELLEHLRSKRRIRRSQHSRIFKDARGQIPEAISIRERPAEVEDRAVPGHWEGDLLRGSRNSHIATLVERHSRFVMLIKVASRDTAGPSTQTTYTLTQQNPVTPAAAPTSSFTAPSSFSPSASSILNEQVQLNSEVAGLALTDGSTPDRPGLPDSPSGRISCLYSETSCHLGSRDRTATEQTKAYSLQRNQFHDRRPGTRNRVGAAIATAAFTGLRRLRTS